MDDRTASFLDSIVITVFVGTWIVLGILGFVASRRMNAAEKRKWMPRGMILVGVLFVIFSTTSMVLESRSSSTLAILFVTVPAVIVISYLNIKMTKFCDNCNATLYNHNWFSPMQFCSKCGAALGAIKPAHGDSTLE